MLEPRFGHPCSVFWCSLWIVLLVSICVRLQCFCEGIYWQIRKAGRLVAAVQNSPKIIELYSSKLVLIFWHLCSLFSGTWAKSLSCAVLTSVNNSCSTELSFVRQFWNALPYNITGTRTHARARRLPVARLSFWIGLQRLWLPRCLSPRLRF